MSSNFSDHPMHLYDRPLVEAIIAKKMSELSEKDIVDLARLLTRYNTCQGRECIKDIIIGYLHQNSKTPEQLQIKAREIWQSGWLPDEYVIAEIGSGADVEAGS